MHINYEQRMSTGRFIASIDVVSGRSINIIPIFVHVSTPAGAMISEWVRIIRVGAMCTSLERWDGEAI